jgi:hypothetical protein
MTKLSRSQQQARGLFFILLLVGHEAQAVGAAVEAASNADFELDGEGADANLTEVNFAVPPSSVTKLAQLASGTATARSLLSVVKDWMWPAQTTLQLESINDATVSIFEKSSQEVILMAGLVYKTIEIEAPGTIFGTLHNQAKIKLVKSQNMDRTKCSDSQYDEPMGTVIIKAAGAQGQGQVVTRDGFSVMGSTTGALALDNVGDTFKKITSDAGTGGNALNGRLVFMYGGDYTLCYTPDGSFEAGDGTEFKNNILLTQMKIFGVKSPCTGNKVDACMDQERWECSFGYKGENLMNCDFNLKQGSGRKDWEVKNGAVSRMTWTEKYSGSGDKPICGASKPDTTALDTSALGLCTSPLACLKLDGISDPVSMPPVKAIQEQAFTLVACYCPNYSRESGKYCDTNTAACCDQYQEYIQPFGMIYYWTIKICDKSGTGTSNYATCTTPYMRVVPQQQFVVRVECPPSGCSTSPANRIKFINPKAGSETPTWDVSHRCKITIGETLRAVWPSISDSKTLSGGGGLDFKAWHTKQVR